MIFLQVPEQIKGFSRTEYQCVFIGFLYAVVAAEFLLNWAKFLRQRIDIRKSYEQLLWSLILFSFFLINWYTSWPRMEFVANSFKDFIFIMLPVMFYYFLVILVFPEETDDDARMIAFAKNTRLLLILICGYTLLQLLYEVIILHDSPDSVTNLLRVAVVISGFFAILKDTVVRRWILFGIGCLTLVKAVITIH